MNGRTIWHDLAAEDVVQACRYLEGRSPASAQRLIAAIQEAIGLLQANPVAGRLREFRAPMAQGIRSWAIQGFDFLLFYRPIGNELEVVRLIHGSRVMPGLIDDEDRGPGCSSSAM